MPRVSVISTVYNGEKYFDRAIPSILAQTYSDFEYVIVDDGSTDKTPELLSELAERDPRVRIFFPGRLGRAKALNYAVSQACGEIIAQQDFDDISYPRRLELQVAFLDENPDVALVGGYYVLIDENRKERYVRMVPTEHEAFVRAMARRIPFAHTVVAFRKQAWEEAGGYPDVEDLEDIRLCIKLAKQGWKLANIPEIVGEHVVHAASYWHQHFRFRDRQRELARVQAQAIRELHLPKWMYLFPLGRRVYVFLPSKAKSLVRRTVGGSRERDLR